MGVISGPLLGAFMLGMFTSSCNTPGVFSGLIVGISLSLWVAVGGTLYPPSPEIMGVLPTYAEQCPIYNSSQGIIYGLPPPRNITAPIPRTTIADEFYALSYLYYGALGTFSTIISGVIVSYTTGPTKRETLAHGLLWWDLGTVQTVKSTEMLPEGEVKFQATEKRDAYNFPIQPNPEFPNTENNRFMLKADATSSQKKEPKHLEENSCFTFWPLKKVDRESYI
ncbi:sodium/iodide cotransporter-like [Bufo bufo]|uniref:sodium/iodide cotransporter-like n=1 Tax=Bufo bufo TaxID=8384 RepID=UPI001ABDF417|nr:sodium/iodide cotransporter-like [Bufo bufo]